ncbi:2Fe-2S iron-sulfur cluster-binding protein [Aminiphilus circumscriptus]|uniref:2Fe-2S iron-sulfur cluster-binding protein n=1 Tax=Aminiphilus circumscriptus TaxID=290732 RepID=UPI0012FBDAA4
MGEVLITLTVNDHRYSSEVSPSLRLLDLLRDTLGFTSVKEGCSEGECGACTVLMNGKAVTSCTIMAFQADGSEIVTVEGLEKRGELEPIKRAFIENDAVQCGFCTPGMIISAKALLDKNATPTEEDVRRALEGNLCRCTGYIPIIKAVLNAAERMGEHAKQPS